jgi:hypothetical protein
MSSFFWKRRFSYLTSFEDGKEAINSYDVIVNLFENSFSQVIDNYNTLTIDELQHLKTILIMFPKYYFNFFLVLYKDVVISIFPKFFDIVSQSYIDTVESRTVAQIEIFLSDVDIAINIKEFSIEILLKHFMKNYNSNKRIQCKRNLKTLYFNITDNLSLKNKETHFNNFIDYNYEMFFCCYALYFVKFWN